MYSHPCDRIAQDTKWAPRERSSHLGKSSDKTTLWTQFLNLKIHTSVAKKGLEIEGMKRNGNRKYTGRVPLDCRIEELRPQRRPEPLDARPTISRNLDFSLGIRKSLRSLVGG